MTQWEHFSETVPPKPSFSQDRNAQQVKAARELNDAINDRDHQAAFELSCAIKMSRSFHPLRWATSGGAGRSLLGTGLPESIEMASPAHPRFPEYIGRKVADSIDTDDRLMAERFPDSPLATLVRSRDHFVFENYLVDMPSGKRRPRGTEAAQIAANLAGTYVREPVPDENGWQGFIVYDLGGLRYGAAQKEQAYETELFTCGYEVAPRSVSPFIPERELDIYGGQPNFLIAELRAIREVTAAGWLGETATKPLT